MALFLRANIHQGNDLFSNNSKGKQCAFMTLSAILTAQNIPLIQWSKMTIDNILIQGDQMYLNTLSSGFVVLDPHLEFLSVDDLPRLFVFHVLETCFHIRYVKLCKQLKYHLG